MKKISLILCLVCSPLLAAHPTTYRDSHGRYMGNATVNGNTTTYRGSHGQYAGRATSSTMGTTYYDSHGRFMGRESSVKPTQNFQQIRRAK